jgi:hypothetical protein
MLTLIRREFTVGVPLQGAWEHLARIEQWPSWAPHIKRIELLPPGELGPQSTGVIHLANGMKPAFRMTEFNPPQNWKWVGRFLWATVEYDHVFEKLGPEKTRMTWVVRAAGFGVSILGKLFARAYNKNLDTAIPRLVAEMGPSKE